MCDDRYKDNFGDKWKKQHDENTTNRRKAIVEMYQGYSRQPVDEYVERYVKLLSGYTPEQISGAVDELAMQSRKHVPSVGEIREVIVKNMPRRSENKQDDFKKELSAEQEKILKRKKAFYDHLVSRELTREEAGEEFARQYEQYLAAVYPDLTANAESWGLGLSLWKDCFINDMYESSFSLDDAIFEAQTRGQYGDHKRRV